ncbi:MAG TPA: sialate O-acetylesterase [Tepidisphaeraceae bacterium]|jgi:sialate O-acetylesterase
MRRTPGVALLLLVVAALHARAGAELQLPSIFGSHMVLQAGAAVPVWGVAEPGKRITVTIAGQSKSADTGADGRWRVTLDALPRGGPEMQITGDGTRTFTDVLPGEVWLCSGQSNMQFALAGANDGAAEVAAADHPQLRLFSVRQAASDVPAADVAGEWTVCTPKTAARFSAVGYFFGREIHRKTGAPVGLIQSAHGGSTAEAWTPLESLRSSDALTPILDRYAEVIRLLPEKTAEHQAKLRQWRARVETADPGNAGEAAGWAQPGFDDSTWTPHDPATFRTVTDKADGAFWFRKTIDIPDAWAGQALELKLGRIDDFDVTYFNGVLVGSTGPDEPLPARKQRTYAVPAAAVKPGPATLAVRVFDKFAGGSFLSTEDGFTLAPAGAAGDAIPLATGWRTRVEWSRRQPEAYPEQPAPPPGPGTPGAPANLYNAMIHPLAPYALRGVIWYQGESNVARAGQYRALLGALIAGWRSAWQVPTRADLPFYVVQLPGFGVPATRPVEEGGWPEIREAINAAAAAAGDSGVAVTIDLGDVRDLHPRNKLDVGRRLAALALRHTYGRRDVTAGGPVYRDLTIRGGRAVLTFDPAGGGLTTRDGAPPRGFAVAGEDRIWHAADAVIHGDTVTVASPAVPRPVAVRYAWAAHPASANLCNSASLPASPFRTDHWPGATDGNH